ncbi:MAG: ESPR-type extended signal peptide-containing protein, partial [Comamonas sp.]
MNRIFHSIWNRALGAWVAAPETARAASAGSASCVLAAPTTPHRPHLGWRPTALALAVAAWVPGVAMAVPVGPNIQVSGDVRNAGTLVTTTPTSPWNLGNNALAVGAQTTSSVDIAGGASVTSSSVYLGGNDGTVNVQELGSRLTTQGLYVGYGGSGRLHITNGGAVSSAYTHVSESPNETAIVFVSGSGSTWTNSGTLLLGVHGIGVLNIVQGGQVKTGAITLGSGTPATARGIVQLYGNAITGRGVLETTQLTKRTSTSTLVFDGGILRASAHQSDFLKGFTGLTLEAGGAYFDTNGYDIGVGTAFASPAGGGLFKQGAGTLTLRGASTYSGGTTISGGTLVAANASALGTGDVTVGTGAALEVASGTALAVGGDLTFQPGSTYRVYANPNGSASSVHASGTATLAGSVLHVGPKSDFAVATPYTILTADGGIAAGTQFDAVQSSYAFLTATLGYSPTSVTLTLQGVEDFGRRVNTANQQTTVRNIQKLGSSSPLYQRLVQTEDSQATAVANSLSGDAHATVGGSLVGLGAFAPSVSQSHLRNNLTAGMTPGAAVAQSDGPLPASAWP